MPISPRQLKAAKIEGGQKASGVRWTLVFPVAAGATADFDYKMPFKGRLVEAHLVKTTGAGGGAGTVQVKKGANAVTDAMSINVADNIITRAASIDDAQHSFRIGDTLRVTRTRTASTNEACILYLAFLKQE